MRYGPFLPAILTLALAGLYGCGDDVTSPDALLESAEAEAVMRSARALPMLPDLANRAAPVDGRDRAVLVRAGELWAAGAVESDRADAHRRLAIGYALPVLVESLADADWAGVRGRMDDWIVTVEAMLQHLELPEIEDRVRGARRLLARSDAVPADARRRGYYLMLAMSELVETTPRFVAVRLVRDAGDALARASAAEGTDPSLQRARRLKDWAERAVVEEDYLLAIQRAYYAIQLVEGS
ncbi:MAG: hypothetical protein ACN0LA_01470 [Candidatus Longimicrobiales bacterium M2_2A_002]